jgi:predicted nucleic acid-binding protein
VTVRPLTTRDYTAVLEEASALGLQGGIVYDALAAQAAKKAGVDGLLTLNPADFHRAWPDGADTIIAV